MDPDAFLPIPLRILRNLQDEAAKREDTMKSRSLSLMIAVALLAGLLVPVRMAARTFRVLRSFTPPPDAGHPFTGLTRDAAGNFYGTTDSGGSGCFFGCGVVFKLAPNGHETVLHTFNETDGAQALDLVRDPAGNLYGTTLEGGISGCHIVFSSECGVVFKLSLRSPTSRSRRPAGTKGE
jgi:uncharacterized repeat protein (TIGR03803 family)